MDYRHEIQQEEINNGIKFTLIGKDQLQDAVDFFFDVFLKDEPATGQGRRNKWERGDWSKGPVLYTVALKATFENINSTVWNIGQQEKNF